MKTVKELLAGNYLRPITLVLDDGRRLTALISEFRVVKAQDTESKSFADIRHSDEDWCDPATLEPSVVVNWFGTLILDEPFKFSNDDLCHEIIDYWYEDE